MVALDERRLRLTRKGRLVADAVLVELLAALDEPCAVRAPDQYPPLRILTAKV
jgi:hypothetical protein